jgi:ubiquinone/menaquinone biosynthesis C-methylase UbiE
MRRAAVVMHEFPGLHTMRVLDLGGSVHFWFESGLINHVGTVVIYNVSHSEVEIGAERSEKIQIKLYDGATLPEETASFDLVISNSVLEHIPHEGRRRVSEEMMRVGKRGFVQTPAIEFPIEPHFVLPFIHWLPRRLGRYLVRLSPWALLSRPSRAKQDDYFAEVDLLSRSDVERLFPGRRVFAERFIGLPKAWLVTW